MSSPELKITTGGRERILQSATLFAHAFATDPVIAYILNCLPSERPSYLPQYFSALLTAAALNGATFTEVDDYKSVVVMMPPGKKVDNPFTLIPAGLLGVAWNIGVGGCWRMTHDFPSQTAPCKKKAFPLPSQKFYYLFFTATHASSRGQGLCSKLITHWQEIVRKEKEQLPIWLEATTEKSMRVYLKCGFEIVGEMRLGKGKVGEDGLREGGNGGKRGEEELVGVPIWGMVWWPEGKKNGGA